MNDFSDLVAAKAVKAGVTATGKKQVFQLLSEIAANAYGVAASDVVERLTERERLGSTGFGAGIAIPHAKLDSIEQVRGAVLLLAEPVAFDAVDDMPVDVIFMLLSPSDSGAEHLKTLARVSRFLRNEAQVKRLRGAKSDDALHVILTGGEARDAA
ncbi:MAG TPA: PTS sugar transporter subunit IIA [Sphingobium sp.]|uniref:PTS sugar transporter subunit IIA n=1 Tax=Sphingobium sp. TaxID=1912891 RepID=UPI002ED4E09B